MLSKHNGFDIQPVSLVFQFGWVLLLVW